jgi:hypothetical protein
MIEIDERFEPWQRHIIEMELRRLARVPRGLTIDRARLDGDRGRAVRREDGSYLVRLDPAGLSLGAFAYIVAHEVQHVVQGHDALAVPVRRLLSDADYQVFEAVCEIAADAQVERLGHRPNIAAYRTLYPHDPRFRPAWIASVLDTYFAEIEPQLLAAAAHDDDRESTAGDRPPARSGTGSTIYHCR